MEWRKYVPTLLTTIRLFAPVYLFPLFMGEYGTGFLCAASAAALTDWVDGRLARWWQCESRLGALLDIFADKVLCWTLMGIGLGAWNYTWWYSLPVAILVVYDGIVMVYRVAGKLLFNSSGIAKAKMLVEVTGLILCLGSFGLGYTVSWIDDIGIGGVWIAAVMGVWSMLCYMGIMPDLYVPSSSRAPGAST